MRFPLLLSCLLTLTMTLPRLHAAGPRDAQWREVEDAVARGLPQTALERLQPLAEAALRDQAWAEAAKAIARRVVLEARIQGDLPQERLRGFARALAEAPPQLQPIFHALLAHAYWGYFEANRWRIHQRTAAPAAGEGLDDVETWDLRRLFAAIDREFRLALANPERLRATPITDFAELLEAGTVPDRQRPTLYDFLAHEAIDFYASGEQAGARPEDAFVLTADSPIFGSPAEFLDWQPTTTDTHATALLAIRVFQDLLRFHQHDAERSAFLDADLARLRFGANTATGADKEERHLAALRAYALRARDHELSALALHEAGEILVRQDKPAEAHALASEGARTFPASPGGRRCRELVGQIESPSLSLTTERIWNAPWPTLDLRHRNLGRVWFRAVRMSWDAYLDRRRNRPERLNADERLALLREPAVREWSHDLPSTPEFRERTTRLPVPADLPPGFYFILARRDADPTAAEAEVSLAPVWVSDLALIVRTRAGQWEGWVLDARSGAPVEGARVEAWHLNRRGERVAVPAQVTGASGTFTFPRLPEGRAFLFKATHRGQSVATADDLWGGGPLVPPRPDERTLFFTDRQLYRPGQLIHYKGISFVAAPAASQYEVLAGRQLTVVLRDPNGREVARQSHRANDYGSFSGTITAPRGGVTGSFFLLVEGEPNGGTSVQVEEYKRPKFAVTLNPPEAAPRLGERVLLTGRATAYTGAAIDGAQVTWRVVRDVRFPPWWGWWRVPGGDGSPSQEIAHGTATTDAEGSFTLEFTAIPDPSAPEAEAPTFQFSVHADVTDGAGETRTGTRTVNAGYTALTAELAADEWQRHDQPVDLRLKTESLDGEPMATTGVIRVHRLKMPDRVVRPPLGGSGAPRPLAGEPGPDPADPRHWELAEVIAQQAFATSTNGLATNRVTLGAGLYRAILETADRLGKKVTAQTELRVLDPDNPRCDLRLPSLVAMPTASVEPGGEFVLLWGTGYSEGRAYVEVEHRHALVQRFWTDADRTQQLLRFPVTEAMRGGFTVHVTYVRENRAYLETRHIEVPWTQKEFDVRWETFRSRLEPGQQETWSAVIRPRKGLSGEEAGSAERLVAEMVATLYDASLDAILPRDWPGGFGCFPTDHSTARTFFANDLRTFQGISRPPTPPREEIVIRYRQFPEDLVERGGARAVSLGALRGARSFGLGGGLGGGAELAVADAMPTAMAMAPAAAAEGIGVKVASAPAAGRLEGTLAKGAAGKIDPSDRPAIQISPRKNLQETAFFLPHLESDTNGTVRLNFTLPEALTEWRFLGFAHDRQLRSGRLEGRAVSARDLMVQPNPPRFLREGDVLEFTAKVLNQSSLPRSGRIRLDLRFALDDAPANEVLGVSPAELPFDVPPRESRTYAWRLEVPDGCGFLIFKVTAASDRLSDGEEGHLPVLARRILVAESLPLPIRGPATQSFTFESLRQAAASPTLRHQGLTLQMASQPAWYAVLALPYLMEFPHECSEQVFNRLYANALARHIAGRDPRIRAVFDQWRGTTALDSPLQKNRDLLAVAIEETPWLRQAQKESEARRNVALLFEGNRLDQETARALQQLSDLQLPEGGWPWFPGGPRDEFITLYITTGFGRLRHLGVDLPLDAPRRALPGLDAWMHERVVRLREAGRLDEVNLDPTVAFYLYGRSFFLAEHPVAEAHRPAFEYWIGQARRHWVKLPHRLPQGHLALALHRCARLLDAEAGVATPQAILRSLRERSVRSEELGRYWRDDERSWSWFRAPIETQALMIEVFDELGGDAATVEDLKVWLLKQKQTQDWKTTKATADAIYALILRGTDLLGSTRTVEVTLGERVFPGIPALGSPRTTLPTTLEPGTGFYEVRLPAAEIRPDLASITVRKADAGIAWGAVHWQYFEDVGRVRPYAGTPLTLTKSLFTRVNTRTGPELRPVSGPVRVGEELMVRVELRVDRDMEYVHLKDQRGSGTEPVNVLSRHRFQDGLGYYESTRDTASHFFIAYLPKGTYVFEYPLRVQHRGVYPSGIATVQCMYAPEFNAHSGSHRLEVK